MYVNVRLSVPEFNLYILSVCILLILWLMRSMKRLYRVLRVRAGILTGRIVHIRALGSSLSYFDGATQSHIDALVHTRQACPPLKISSLHVPFLIQSINISKVSKESVDFEVSIWVSCKCKVWIGGNFIKHEFKRAFTNRNDTAMATSFDKSNDVTSATSGVSGMHLSKVYEVMNKFNNNEECIGFIVDNNNSTAGQKITFTVPIINLHANPVALQNESSQLFAFGLFIVPFSYTKGSKSSGFGSYANTKSSMSSSNAFNVLHSINDKRVTETDSGNKASLRHRSSSGNSSPLQSSSSSSSSIEFAVNVINCDVSVLGPTSTETLLFLESGDVYTIEEIFGMNNVLTQQESATAAAVSNESNRPSQYTSSNNELDYKTTNFSKVVPISTGIQQDDCVICLTEPQQVLLLPCRHMCVCRSCLPKIGNGKCPVCRAHFDEYMAMITDDTAATVEAVVPSVSSSSINLRYPSRHETHITI